LIGDHPLKPKTGLNGASVLDICAKISRNILGILPLTRRTVLFRGAQNSSPPAHWSKDFVEHLRTVHFTLIGVATTLILIVLSAKPYNPIVALRQIRQILELKKMWSPDQIRTVGTTTSEHRVTSGYGSDLMGMGEKNVPVDSEVIDLRIGEEGRVFYRKVMWQEHPRRSTVVQFSIPVSWLKYGKEADWSPEEFPRTPSDFRRWWEHLTHGYRIILPTMISVSDGYISDGASRKIGRILKGDPNKAKPGNLAPRETIELDSGIDQKYDMPVYAGWTSDNSIVSFPIGEYLQVAVTQQTLCKYFENWKTGAFDTAFADLAHATHDLEVLQFEDLEKIISEEAAKGSEVFEAFGMKFPAGQISLWGIVTLLGVQLYFFVYLKQLSGTLRPNDPGWDVPWLGMNTSFLARVVFFVSTVLLPLFALSALAARGIFQLTRPIQWDRWTVAKTAILVGVLIPASVLALLWKNRPKL
jgi:hypothetical protein